MQVVEQQRTPCETPGCPGHLLRVGLKQVCSVCETVTVIERPKRQERRKIDLEDEHVIKILSMAKFRNPRDFSAIALLCHGFRRSEVCGSDEDKVMLEGLQVQDAHPEEEYVWVHGKGGTQVQQPALRMVLETALSFAGREGNLIPWLSPHQLNLMLKGYADDCGLPDAELLSCHRLRH